MPLQSPAGHAPLVIDGITQGPRRFGPGRFRPDWRADFPLATRLTFSPVEAPLGVEVWSGGGTLHGFLPRILQASFTRRVNQLGAFSFTIRPQAQRGEYEKLILAASPSAYWRLNEQSGTTADDAVGSNNGTYTNSPSLASPTLIKDRKSSVAFNGTTQYVTIPTSSLLQGGNALTVECWVRVLAYGGRHPLGFYGNATDKSYFLSIGNAGDVGFWGSADGSAQTGADAPNGSVAVGGIYHLVGTYDGSNLRMYLNGILMETKALAGPLWTVATADAFSIGRHDASGSGDYRGSIQHVAVYQRVMGIAEILSHYEAGRDGTPSSDILTIGREIRLFREGDGEIFRGIISARQTQASENGPLLIVSGTSLAQELVWVNTYFGIPENDADAATAIDDLLSGTSWTKKNSLTLSKKITDLFPNQTVFRALNRLAEVQGGYIRETATAREVEVKNTTTVSGKRLINVESGPPDTETEYGLVKSIVKREELVRHERR